MNLGFNLGEIIKFAQNDITQLYHWDIKRTPGIEPGENRAAADRSTIVPRAHQESKEKLLLNF